MKPTNWACPYCGRSQVVTDANYSERSSPVDNTEKGELGPVRFRVQGIVCLNPSCKKLTLNSWLHEQIIQSGNYATGDMLNHWPLLPESTAKPQPEYVPKAIRDDYFEACRIRELSPKSSATLARRCLQGMIRDFCKIQKGRLIDEITELRDRVDKGSSPQGVTHESVEAIDHVRSIGNIGAHMEKDVDVIIDIDPGEAQALIDLIEMLLVEWYVARKQRQDRLARVASIGAQKKQQQAGAKAAGGVDTEPVSATETAIPEESKQPGTA